MTARAETRPGVAVHDRPWAVGAYLAFVALVGLAWSAPLAAAIAGVTGAYPRGDLEIIDPGGVMLIEAARRVGSQIAAIGAAWTVVAVVALPLGLFVLAFATALYAGPQAASSPGTSRALVRAARAFPSFVVLGLVTLIADAAVIALITIGGGAAARSIWPEPPDRDIARYGLYAAVLAAVCAVGVLHDLARAAVITGPSRAYMAMRAALLAVRRHAGRAAWAYTWRALLGVASLAAAAWLAERIGQRSTAALVVTAFVHQLGLALTGWLRLSWLVRAMTLVRPAPSPEGASRKEPLA